MNHLLFQYKIIGNKIDKNIEKGIAAAAHYISKGLLINEFLEWRISKVKQGNNKVLQSVRLCKKFHKRNIFSSKPAISLRINLQDKK